MFRDYPLNSIHPLAFKEAEAAECAGEQGKFWEYADALYAVQAEISSSHSFDQELASLARGIHADPAALKECLDSGKFGGVVTNEMKEAERLQIAAAPTIFLDNKRHEGAMSYEVLQKWLANHPT